jgi:hypothetical protein
MDKAPIVEAEAPTWDQGETTDNLNPAPNATISVSLSGTVAVAYIRMLLSSPFDYRARLWRKHRLHFA